MDASSKKHTKKKVVIGTEDRIDLPELDLFDLPCKIDTGAETSAIHCHYIKMIERNGEDMISFRLLDPDHPEYDGKVYSFKDFDERRVKNSFGQSEFRYVIRTIIIIFGKKINAQFTLADRSQMRFPVLLGKRLLKNRFLVDVSLKDVSFQFKQLNQPSS